MCKNSLKTEFKQHKKARGKYWNVFKYLRNAWLFIILHKFISFYRKKGKWRRKSQRTIKIHGKFSHDIPTKDIPETVLITERGLMAFRRRCGHSLPAFLMQSVGKCFYILVWWSHMELARHMSDFWDLLQQGQLAFCVITSIRVMETTRPQSDETPVCGATPSLSRKELFSVQERSENGKKKTKKQQCTPCQVGFKRE